MCILFLIVNSNPEAGGYKLILASNRDEFYCRPAKNADEWSENHENNSGVCTTKNLVFGGRDMEAGREGGTWLALSVNETKKVFKAGALLNLTGEPKKNGSLGRGPIVVNYVAGPQDNHEYTNQLINGDDTYNSFNLVSLEIGPNSSSLIHSSNAPHQAVVLPENQPYGFGNSSLDVPLQKVKNGVDLFKKAIDSASSSSAGDRDALRSRLVNILSLKEKFWPDDELLRRAPNWGEPLSRICVKMQEAGYGTRTKTVILIDDNDRLDFYEETMETSDPDGEWKTTHITRDFFK